MSSALYIGAGLDTYPITECDFIKYFYYIDSQPNSEFGIDEHIIPNPKYYCIPKCCVPKINKFSRPTFIKNLNDSMSNIGMFLTEELDNLKIYSNNKQVVYYHTNTPIPEYNNIIKLIKYEYLIVAGYHPNCSFLTKYDTNLKFIGFQGTNYSKNKSEKNDITSKLHYDKDICNKFNSFEYIYRDNKNSKIFSNGH